MKRKPVYFLTFDLQDSKIYGHLRPSRDPIVPIIQDFRDADFTHQFRFYKNANFVPYLQTNNQCVQQNIFSCKSKNANKPSGSLVSNQYVT